MYTETISQTLAADVLRYTGAGIRPAQDMLAVEAVLQIRVNGAAYTATVRTPGADRELARGLLFTEGVIPDLDASMRFHEIPDPETGLTGQIDVIAGPEHIAKDVSGRRSTMVSASCGFCGLRHADDIAVFGRPDRIIHADRLELARVQGMFTALDARQPVFQASGGCHAAGAFALDGRLLAAHEDIGRHNAVDKCIGAMLEAGTLRDARALLVSGRASYEIVFKAWRARIPFVLAVSAPSSLAVEMAQRFGITLLAFCRDSSATIYSHPEYTSAP